MRQELARHRIRSQQRRVQQPRCLQRNGIRREERLEGLGVEERLLHDASAGNGRHGGCGDIRLQCRRTGHNEKGSERRGPQTDHAI